METEIQLVDFHRNMLVEDEERASVERLHGKFL